MTSYGKAFKTIRLIKDMRLDEAAQTLGIDERTLRDIEAGKTKLISERFDQMLDLYKIERDLVFDLAQNNSGLHNVVHEAKRDGIVVHQADASKESTEDLTMLQKRIEVLEATCLRLEENEKFLKSLILKAIGDK